MIKLVNFTSRFGAVLMVICLAVACRREHREPVIGVAYVSAAATNLKDSLGGTQYTVATLKQGEKLDILQRQHHWLRVRTAANVQGWISERHTVGQDVYQKIEKLRQSAVALPSQGQAKARRDVNLHSDPDRKSPSYFSLKEDETCEVLKRAFSERPPRPKQKPDTKEYEDWFLVRTKTGAGWGLAGNLDMAAPEEVLQYAEGKRVVAWFVLDEIDGKPTILWATTSGMGLPTDFDAIRVFSWGVKRKRYETMYIDRNVHGYFPILTTKNPIGFSYTGDNKQGEKTQYKFVLQVNRIKRVQ